MKLEPLYRIEFSYPEHYDVGGLEVRGVYFAEGRCDGYLTGRFRGMNHPRLRAEDDTYAGRMNRPASQPASQATPQSNRRPRSPLYDHPR